MPAESVIEPPAALSVRAVTCPACGGGLELRAAGYSVSVACQYCGSLLDVADPMVRLVVEEHRAARHLEIPLGTRGTLRGVEWEAVGYLRRSIRGAYPWEEYLLFNPYHGYRWLVTDGRGWSFGEMLTAAPSKAVSSMIALGDDLYDAFFANSVAQVDYVVGEFYWRVRVGEEVKAADWVRPGWMLSRESNAHEVSWTLLELLEPRAVERAFGASPSGSWWPPMPHQPSPHSAWLKQGLKVAIGAVAALILLMFLFGNSRWGEVGSFPIASDGATRSVTLGPVELTGSYQHIDIRAEVPVLNNGWVDLDYALVNRATQKAYEAYAAAERYSGRDSDGDWNEGSRRASVSIASVPAGTYDLVLEYKGNRWSSTSTTPAADEGWMAAYNEPRVIVEIRQGALYGSNLVLAMILIAIPLVIGLVRHIHFDQARRAESDFGG